MAKIRYDELDPDPWETHRWWITYEFDAVAGMDADFIVEGLERSKLKAVAAVVVERCSAGVFDTSDGRRLPLSMLLDVDLEATFDTDESYWVRADERETGTYVQVVLAGPSLEIIWFPGQVVFGLESSQFAYFPADPPPRPSVIEPRPDAEQRSIFRALTQFALDLADAGGASLVAITAASDDIARHPDSVLWRSVEA